MPDKSFLILDDDEAVGETIQFIAESLGYRAKFVTHARDFFASLDEMFPDIITIDLVMPELDGVEVMRLLGERNYCSRIIISSGMGTRVLDAAQRAAAQHKLNILGVISKPVSREAMRILVGESCDLKLPQVIPEKLSGQHNGQSISKADLQQALDRHEFVVAYQPKIHCGTGAPAGFEALARWEHPQRGTIMPIYFIPLAEEYGLIDVLTAQVFDQSLAWFSRYFAQSGLYLSLNVSARSLVAMCGQYAINPDRIVLELTESSAMVDPILSLDLMTRLRVKGFQLSIDDFGTGFSSMVQFVRLPFSEIKVDKSFVMRSQESAEARAVIKSIIDLGHSLGLVVTGEGVENSASLDYLNSLGCDLAQGFFIALPMTGAAAIAWVNEKYLLPS